MANTTPLSSCLTCPRRQETEWSDLSTENLEFVDKHKHDSYHKAGHVLYHQGDDSEGIYCIKEGLVGERRLDAEGNSILVRLSHPGTTIGYQELLSKSTHPNSAELLKPSHVCFMSRTLVRQLLQRDPSLGERFLRRSMLDFKQLEDEYFISRTMDVQARFLHVLMVFYERFGSFNDTEGHVVELPINRQDIAALVGAAPESLSRTIRRIQNNGLVAFSGRKANIPDLDAVFSQITAEAG